jgi:CubicO group peptidase (beta-lactamase class C family)
MERTDLRLLPPRVLTRVAETPAPLDERMAYRRVPGLSLAVIRGGEIAWTRGHGVTEAAAASPVTPDTLFQAGSISKPVTAVATMRLAERGLLHLDEVVNSRLQGWRIPANGPWQPRITLRHLLSHTAGLTVSGFPGYPEGAPLPTLPQILNAEYPANTPKLQCNLLPGLTYRYSGGGYTVLQLLLEEVTATPFADLLQELVLEPLGMVNSTFAQPLPAPWRDKAATGHLYCTGDAVPGRWRVHPELAAAGLWSTAPDLARFVLDMQASLQHDQGRLLRQATVQEMLTPQGDPQMGLGFFLRSGARFEHGGDTEGYSALFTAFMETGEGAVLMTNAESGYELNQEVVRGLAAQYGWPGILPEPPHPTAISPDGLEAFVGVYDLASGLRITVLSTGSDLWMQVGEQPAFALVPVADREFSAAAANVTVTFREDGLTLKQQGATNRAARIA